MNRRWIAAALAALLLAGAGTAVAQDNPLAPKPPPINPLAQKGVADGRWTGTGEETIEGGVKIPYAVTLVVSGAGSAADLVAGTRVTTQDGKALDVEVRGSFKRTGEDAFRFESPDVKIRLGDQGTQSAGALTLILEQAGPDRLTGRVGNETDGWTTLSLTRAEAPTPPGPTGEGRRLPRPKLPPELAKRVGLYDVLATVPGVRELAPPEWAKEGVRITWWTGSAIIQDQAGQSTLTEDPRGNLLDPATGKKYRESSVTEGSAAVGFTQLEITGVSPEVVVMKISTFLHDGTVERPSLIATTQIICPPSGCEFWIHPKALAALAAQKAIAFAGRRTANGQTRDVVVVRGGNGHTVYDAETGMQVSYSSKSKNSGTETYYDPATGQAQVRPKTGATLAVNVLRGVRETSFGGLSETPLPTMAYEMKGAEFQMTRTFEMDAGGGPQTTSATIVLDRVGGEGNWLFIRYTTKMSLPGVAGPGKASVVHAVTMPAEVGCSFLPLEFLRGLTEGQELDRDPITGYATRVASVGKTPEGRSVAVIVREGPDQRTSFVYDTGTGMMVTMDKIERAAGTTTRTRLSVVRTW